MVSRRQGDTDRRGGTELASPRAVHSILYRLVLLTSLGATGCYQHHAASSHTESAPDAGTDARSFTDARLLTDAPALLDAPDIDGGGFPCEPWIEGDTSVTWDIDVADAIGTPSVTLDACDTVWATSSVPRPGLFASVGGGPFVEVDVPIEGQRLLVVADTVGGVHLFTLSYRDDISGRGDIAHFYRARGRGFGRGRLLREGLFRWGSPAPGTNSDYVIVDGERVHLFVSGERGAEVITVRGEEVLEILERGPEGLTHGARGCLFDGALWAVGETEGRIWLDMGNGVVDLGAASGNSGTAFDIACDDDELVVVHGVVTALPFERNWRVLRWTSGATEPEVEASFETGGSYYPKLAIYAGRRTWVATTNAGRGALVAEWSRGDEEIEAEPLDLDADGLPDVFAEVCGAEGGTVVVASDDNGPFFRWTGFAFESTPAPVPRMSSDRDLRCRDDRLLTASKVSPSRIRVLLRQR